MKQIQTLIYMCIQPDKWHTDNDNNVRDYAVRNNERKKIENSSQFELQNELHKKKM